MTFFCTNESKPKKHRKSEFVVDKFFLMDFVSKKIALLQRNTGALNGQDTKSLIVIKYICLN